MVLREICSECACDTHQEAVIQLDQSVYIYKVLDKFADFVGPSHKTRKCPLPSDAPTRLPSTKGS